MELRAKTGHYRNRCFKTKNKFSDNLYFVLDKDIDHFVRKLYSKTVAKQLLCNKLRRSTGMKELRSHKDAAIKRLTGRSPSQFS